LEVEHPLEGPQAPLARAVREMVTVSTPERSAGRGQVELAHSPFAAGASKPNSLASHGGPGAFEKYPLGALALPAIGGGGGIEEIEELLLVRILFKGPADTANVPVPSDRAGAGGTVHERDPPSQLDGVKNPAALYGFFSQVSRCFQGFSRPVATKLLAKALSSHVFAHGFP
jgi:hypothetical protein